MTRVGILLKILYWLAVLAISLALLVGLVLFLESRDPAAVESAAVAAAGSHPRVTEAQRQRGGLRALL